jgi:hypothetical protein
MQQEQVMQQQKAQEEQQRAQEEQRMQQHADTDEPSHAPHTASQLTQTLFTRGY